MVDWAQRFGDLGAGLRGHGALQERQALRAQTAALEQKQAASESLVQARELVFSAFQQELQGGSTPQQAFANLYKRGVLTEAIALDATVLDDVEQAVAMLSPKGPQFQSMGPGTTFGTTDPTTNVFTPQGRTPFAPQAQTNITVGGGGGPQFGAIPQGFMLKSDKDGSFWMEPVSGGPAAREAATAEEKEAAQQAHKEAMVGLVTGTIDRVIGKANNFTVGYGSLLAPIPGTPAADLAAELDTIHSNVGLEQLQAMRANSPTGGALGSVTESEHRLLQSILGATAQSQSPEQFKENMLRVKEQVLRIVHGPEAAEALIQRDISAMAEQERASKNATRSLEDAIKAGDAAAVNQIVSQMTKEQLGNLRTDVLDALNRILEQ
jgi:hypothetical protein